MTHLRRTPHRRLARCRIDDPARFGKLAPERAESAILDGQMLAKPESACFVIADISGYTGFLAGRRARPRT
jgi:hypothetical protein